MPKTYFDIFNDNAERNPDKILLCIGDNTITYSAFMNETARIASGMKALGIVENDKVGLIMSNSVEWYVVY